MLHMSVLASYIISIQNDNLFSYRFYNAAILELMKER